MYFCKNQPKSVCILFLQKHNIPFHVIRLFVPKQLNFKLPDIIQIISPRASILLHDMGHQPQVPFHQDVPGLQIPFGCTLQIIPLLFLGQWFGEGPGGQLQGIQQAAEHQPGSSDHCHHLRLQPIRQGLSIFLPYAFRRWLIIQLPDCHRSRNFAFRLKVFN